MGEVIPIVAGLVALLVVVPVLVVGVIFLAKPVFKGLAWLITHIVVFIGRELGDLLRTVGALITSLVLVPITLFNVLIGRWSSAAHYGRAIETEMKSIIGCVYRIVIGNPARLLLLTPLTEGIEQRIPAAVAHAPGSDRPSRRQGQFDGYTIVGSLPGGGSGSKLYVATPSAQKLAAFAKAGQTEVDKVVIKSFSLSDGSTLPQIVRENRALPAAKRLGLILEHELTEDRFFYITRYVPGDSLGVVATRLHAMCGGGGLSGKHLTEALDYAADVVRTLHTYHSGGLWHKDVKPDNIIVAAGQAHLVDFGLVTPLRSSMTLTTHGTEYFRDPEMVRMALRGVKVHEVDGAKFDIYAAGAVLYALIENSFPAHGGLSQISRKCPETVRWIVRRAMTEYDKRYDSAATMLEDLDAVLAAPDPFAVRPIDLPSMRGGNVPQLMQASVPDMDEIGAASIGRAAATPAAFAAPAMAAVPAFGVASARGAARFARSPVQVTSWWTGKYALAPVVVGSEDGAAQRVPGLTAAEQLGRARDRARAARDRARARLEHRRGDFPGGVNKGVGFSLAVLIFVTAILVMWFVAPSVMRTASSVVRSSSVDAGEEFTDAMAEASETLAEAREELAEALPVAVAGPAAPTAPEAPMPHARQTASKPASSSGVESARSVGPMPPLGKLLIVKDQGTFDKETQSRVEAQLKRLDESRFELLGIAVEPTERVEVETRLNAELRSAVGVLPFQSDEAANAVRDWLVEHADIAAVIWIDQTVDGKVESWVVRRTDLDKNVLNKIVGALKGRKGG